MSKLANFIDSAYFEKIPVSKLANFVEFACFIVLGGGSDVWNATPKVRDKFFELEHLFSL